MDRFRVLYPSAELTRTQPVLRGRFKKQSILLRVVLSLLGIIAASMVPALIMAAAAGETAMIPAFALPMLTAAALALPSFGSLRNKKMNLNGGDGFLLVFVTWVLASFLGAVPFYLSPAGLNFTDALFESVSAFATTGGTVIADVEVLPRSLLLWRSCANWFGGMGIVLISVALMPLLGIGGFQLIKAEASGPEKEKITPKIAVTAKLLWLSYSVLTLILCVLYLLGGMTWFDAVCHSLTTVASGGVSRNLGLAYFDSPFIDGVSTVFMLLVGLNFNLYYYALQGKFQDIRDNTEARVYLLIFFAAAGIITVSLLPVYGSLPAALRHAAYQTASILSTSGANITNYETWPGIARMTIFSLMLIGGCSGSTAGGVKVIRHVVLWKQMSNEIRRARVPSGVFSIQINKRVGRKDVVYGTAGFVFLYALVVLAAALITAASGTDVFSSFSAAISITGNIGVGFGAIGPGRTYGGFPDHVKWLYSFVMIAGRLELWTVLVLFTPAYWNR
ncbi:MAG: TrkH family potassium uptake protein [Spirochaetaceae bacterium]|jgi:trk system potassium uptake protein TrkH|nr:TrkH family potassium uptake protein [Spirochaetaceae bacterium]